MVCHVKLIGLAVALLLVFLPSSALAQSFSVSPAEVNIDDLSPGEEAKFDLTIHNKGEVGSIFTLTTYSPSESERRPGRASLPGNNWISFSPHEIEVPANSEAKVKVTIAIPPEQKWVGGNWEVWLGATPESSDLLTVKLYVRLLVSTSGSVESGSNIGLFVGIGAGILLLGYGVYYSRRKAKPRHQL
jgi:hypothetical protein